MIRSLPNRARPLAGREFRLNDIFDTTKKLDYVVDSRPAKFLFTMKRERLLD